ncbi:MAG: glycosyltransferase family 4 protein [Hyphomicrobium sp.]
MTDKPRPGFAGPIAYLTGEYPRATDTFIQREVMALRASGISVLTCSMRRTPPEHHVGNEQREEARQTFNVMPSTKSPIVSVGSHVRAFVGSPRRYLAAFALAMRTGSPGLRARMYQLIYFAEAVVLAVHLKKAGVVHLHNHIAMSSGSVAMIASAVSGIPHSFTMHGPDIFFEPQRWRLDEKIARATFVACISDFCRSQGMIFSDPIHWSKMHVVHCGVTLSRYSESRGGRADAAAGMGPRILFVGRLAAVKGLPILFDAAKNLLPMLPNLRVTLIGDGPERRELEDRACSLGLADAVHFAGYKSQDEVAAALRTTDMLILPSFAEGLPVVLMEAMAGEVPVISTRIAGVAELVEDGVNGLLIPPGDVGSIEQAIQRLSNDPELRARMGAAGRRKVAAEFDVEKEAGWLAQLFETYASGAEKPAKRPAPKCAGA